MNDEFIPCDYLLMNYASRSFCGNESEFFHHYIFHNRDYYWARCERHKETHNTVKVISKQEYLNHLKCKIIK